MTERELARIAARRLAIIRHAQEVSGSVASTCRYYGISRPTYYTWFRRYEELGIEGLRPRSRRPLTSPNATTGEVIGRRGGGEPGRSRVAEMDAAANPAHNAVVRRLVIAGALAVLLASSCSESTPASNEDTAGYTAPEGPGDPFYYSAIQYQYDQGDCGGLDTIIQGWHAPPVDPKADSYIAEAEKAKVALGCP